MKTLKPGRLTAADRKNLHSYQVANGLQADGKAGHQSVNHLLDAALRARQPDDPGPGGDIPAREPFASPFWWAAMALAAAFLAWALLP